MFCKDYTYMPEKFLTKIIFVLFFNLRDRVCVLGGGRHFMRE